MQAFNRYQTESINKKKLFMRDIVGVNRISNFTIDCSLKDILNLPWKDMLEIDKNFGDALTKIYSSLVIRDKDYNDGKMNRYPFSLNVALIPYAQELDIANLNKTWALPAIWLVGCSFDEVISADSFNMSSSGFFEHDLFHLSSKIEHTDTEEIYPEVLHWVKNIYQNKIIIESINTIKFTAVELVIFLIAHEDVSISKCSNIKQALIALSNNIALSGLEDLPVEYAQITYNDIRKAAKWLSFLPTMGYTKKEFAQATLELKAKTDYIDYSKISLSIHK